ncbi:SRPBCC domain-containing protein [Paenarthrobacter sp. NPDC056912]|uniref:SRPBCC family protein n=1 Tax=Paenarthrobacter sp. NPDC056912 TaxID=3345965 RepID=UPI00366CF0A2
MKNLLHALLGILLVAVLLLLGVFGVMRMRADDPSGVVALATGCAGLLAFLVYLGLPESEARARRRLTVREPLPEQTSSTTVSAEYPYPPSAVWALIRPAEAALYFGDGDVIEASKVPGTPDGPGEQQRFVYRNGFVSVIEVVSEIPEHSAVTQRIEPPGDASFRTTYLLEPTAGGCRFTMETVVKAPFAVNPGPVQEFGASFLVRVGEALGTIEPPRADADV